MRLSSLLAPVVGAAAAFTLLPAAAQADTVHAAETTTITAQGADASIRFATFNVRTARADRGTSHAWLHRVSTVARQIKAEAPDVVALQELGPGRADGKATKINGAARQTESLVRALSSMGAGNYKLVRTTAYVKPGTTHGTQGARILYNTNKVRLVSNCAESTGKLQYNGSCAVDLPILKGDSKGETRSAAYAEFEDRQSGRNFFVVSVHLDDRHSGSTAKERKLQALRGAQVKKVYTKVAGLANGKPILFAGDLNSWKTKQGGSAPHSFLSSHGFKDGASAKNKSNSNYPTVNHFKTTLKANAPGRQVALDVVMVKGGNGSFSSYRNVMKPVDSARPSDHNMVVGNLHLS